MYSKIIVFAVLAAAIFADNCTDVQPDQRKDCGFSGINQQLCEAKGCCWIPLGHLAWCFFPSGGPIPPSPKPTPATPGPTPSGPTPPPGPLPGCETYRENQCQGDDIVTADSFEDHRWQTPNKGDADYRASYHDFSQIVGHAGLVYSSDHKSVTVTIHVLLKNPSLTVTFSFNGISQKEPSKIFTSSTSSPVRVSATASDGSALLMDDLDFVWSAPSVNHTGGDFRNGQKGSIVEFFGWRHADIEEECAFLAKAGYLGAKVFPPHEQVMANGMFQNTMNPWYFMYQPVSYRLQGRMGSRDNLRSMIHKCRSQNVRVYADAVVNHMVGGGNDGAPSHRNGNGGGCVYWGPKNTSAGYPNSTKSGVSPFYTQDFNYALNKNTNRTPTQEFPAVPYGPLDFHCERPLNAWTDPLQLNAGWLTGLTDLNTERPNVQQRIADYLTDLLSIGFSGFRMDAAKHIKPEDLGAIFGRVKKNLGGTFPVDFIAWLEVLLGGEADLLLCNPESGYSYSVGLVNALKANGLTDEDVDKIKIWYSAYPKEPDVDCGQVSRHRLAIQNDDADQQNPGSTSRDMGSQGSVLVIQRDVPAHRKFEVMLFSNPPGAKDNNNDYPIRMVLSSYYLTKIQSSYGMPDGLSECSTCVGDCSGCEDSVLQATAFKADGVGYAGPVFTRVHRDQAIIDAMRAWMKLS